MRLSLSLLVSFLFFYSSSSKYIVKLKDGVVLTQTPNSINIGKFSGLVVDDSHQLDVLMDENIVEYYETDSVITSSQFSLSWGLDRIDQESLPLNRNYSPNSRGSGMYVYVLDTGTRITHQEFEGRVDYGINIITDTEDSVDRNGHGTHVMSTVLGKTVE